MKLFRIVHFALLFAVVPSMAQTVAQPELSVEKIMRDPKWIGSSPSSPRWNADGSKLYFYWNPDKQNADSLYVIERDNMLPRKVSFAGQQEIVFADDLTWNNKHTAYTYTRNGDVIYTDVQAKKNLRITQTQDAESNAAFSFFDQRIVFTKNQNVYAWDITTGITEQLTDLRSGNRPPAENDEPANTQEKWLQQDQLKLFDVLREKERKQAARKFFDSTHQVKKMQTIYTGTLFASGHACSPDGRFISYRLFKRGSGKNTFIPEFITKDGFTGEINGRTKVGSVQGTAILYVYDRLLDTVYNMNENEVPGIKDIPAYYSDYPSQLQEKQKRNANRIIDFSTMKWSKTGSFAIVEITSQDNKDRWLMQWDTATHILKLVDRQHNDAWIGGPGINAGSMGWVNDDLFWFESEASGYAHIYIANIKTGQKEQITSGNWEVQNAALSKNAGSFFITANKEHPGQKDFYRVDINTKKITRITQQEGGNEVIISPDEKELAILYSNATTPWELYIQKIGAGQKEQRVTHAGASAEFLSYHFQQPEIVTFAAGDGATVYARLYKPANITAGKPAVIFVHGAGYLQNAHKWWSSYFREYMFNNLLAANGYFVMDVDYRASAGYGANWRTGIYRHMGGKDLDDQVDAAKFLTEKYGVNSKRIGLYGGSYGGFITLMAMFTRPNIFASGAALRSVTDWSNYNHGYTSNILNTPASDSLAYQRSSPIYFAEGLQGNLLMCHGMVDVNVHYQDIIKLTQRLIELHKDKWELASYPVEDHGFTEPSSWTDEYKRIFKLFETTLKSSPH